jgi:hypothetical protein
MVGIDPILGGDVPANPFFMQRAAKNLTLLIPPDVCSLLNQKTTATVLPQLDIERKRSERADRD